MARSLPSLNNLEALESSGPFPKASEPRWFDGNAPAWLGMREYQSKMASLGSPPEVAAAIVASLRQHGCEQLYWRTAIGGRRGRTRAFWDVRVAATDTPAGHAVPDVISLSASPPPGATTLAVLADHPNVLQAYSQSTPERQTVWSRRPILGGHANVRAYNHLDYTHTAFAALAIGHFGSTVNVGATSRTAAEASLAHLVDLVLRDLNAP